MLQIALPNKGSLSEEAVRLVREAGYATRHDARDLTPAGRPCRWIMAGGRFRLAACDLRLAAVRRATCGVRLAACDLRLAAGSTVLDLFPHTPHVEVVTRFDKR